MSQSEASETPAPDAAKLERIRQRIETSCLAPLFFRRDEGLVVLLSGWAAQVNVALERLLGFTDASELLDAPFERWVHAEDRPAFRALLEGRPPPALLRLIRTTGECALVEVLSLSPLEGSEDPAPAAMVLRDVTEHRRRHARMLLEDRMMSIGTLAAGVAHEVNNPLSYVIGNLLFLEEELEDGASVLPKGRASVAQAVREARQGAERLREIVRNLQAFARPDHQVSRSTDVRHTVELALNMAWIEIRHRARLIKDFQPVPEVEASEARLGQIFLSLLLNAAHALPEGKADEHQIRVHIASEGERVMVEIANTGPSIRPEVAARIFDPFATFGEAGVGSGFGLSVAHSLVSDLGGELRVDSRGGGNAFRVVLGAARARSQSARDPAPAVAASVGERLRILVVDDEALHGAALKRALGEHQVVVLASGRAAIERLRVDAAFDLIVCDLMMPDLTGMDVFEWLEMATPGLERRMVFVTGGTFTPRAQQFLERVPNTSFQKPLDIAAFRAFVRGRGLRR